jgi:hypothetical protein
VNRSWSVALGVVAVLLTVFAIYATRPPVEDPPPASPLEQPVVVGTPAPASVPVEPVAQPEPEPAAPAVLTCRAAALQVEGMERLAGVIMLLNGDVTAYAENYANMVLAETATNCGLPAPSVERHRAAVARLRQASALPEERLAALEAAVARMGQSQAGSSEHP